MKVHAKTGLGSMVDATPRVNCGTCQLRDRCRDPRKSRRYACTLHVERTGPGADPSEQAFLQQMRELVTKESVLPDPFAIQDGDAPEAPSFFAWCVGKTYLNMDPLPYPKQLQIGMKIFGDACPWCSARDWYDDIPHDCDVMEIPRRIQLRRFGRCPSCGRSLLDGIRAGREGDVNTFLGCLGQRCVTGDTLVTTNRGLIRIEDLAEGASPGWNPAPTVTHGRKKQRIALSLETGSLVRQTGLWVSTPERVVEMVTRHGYRVDGTRDHPIKTLRGFVPLRDVVPGDVVPIYVGQNVWGQSTVLTPDLARFIGFWVSGGAGNGGTVRVSSHDPDVLDLCEREMKRLSPGAIVRRRDRDQLDPDCGIYQSVESSDKALYARVDFLVDGLWRGSADRVVPRAVLQSPRATVCAFLQALFEGAGRVSKGRSVGYASPSRELVQQVQTLLANLGIPSCVRSRWSRATNGSPMQVSKPYWVLVMMGPALETFQRCVGFQSTRKREALTAAVRYAREGERQPHWYERYPDVVKQAYLRLVSDVDRAWAGISQACDDGGPTGFDASFRTEVEDWRRLHDGNAILSRISLRRYWKLLRSSHRLLDLPRELRKRLCSFHELLLDPRLVWTTVASAKLSSDARVTYDFHVPTHHRFMANGILNHNSGKCLVGDTVVPTDHGTIPIRDVLPGYRVLIDGQPHEVSARHVTSKRRVFTLTTKAGYSLTGTIDHPLLTSEGWKPMRNARNVRVSAEPCVRPTMPEYRRIVARTGVKGHPERPTAAYVASLPLEVAERLIRARVMGFWMMDNHLALHVDRKDRAWLQESLLQWGILSTIADHERRFFILLDPLHACRYLKAFGIPDQYKARVVWHSRGLAQKAVLPEACKAVERLIRDQDYGGYKDILKPGPLRLAQEILHHATVGELTRRDAALMLRAVDQLPTRDFLSRAQLQTVLRGIARGTSAWVEVESVRKQPEKVDVYDIEVPTARSFVAGGIVAHNSTGIGLLMSYHTHKLLKLKNPSAFYRIKAGTILHNNIIGINYSGAKQNVWDPLLATMADSPWFQTYHSILEDAGRKRGDDDFVKIKDSFIYYKPAGLWLSPSSPSRRSLRGRTRSGFVVDELSHFSEDTKKVNISGLEVWRALTRSLQTLRPAVNRLRKRGIINVPPGLACGISSPWDVSDPLMTLMNQAVKNRDKTIYTVLLPTWEANPDITFEDLKPEFRADPVSAWRDLGCRPPYSAASFVNGLEPFHNVILPRRPACTQETYPVRSRRTGKPSFLSARLRFRWTNTTVPKLLSLDAGRFKNSFGVTVLHLDQSGRVVYDAFVEVHPRPNLPVGYQQVYRDVLVPLVEKLKCVAVVSDRWQNYAITDRLRDEYNLEVLELRLKYEDFTNWRDDLLSAHMGVPRPECGWDDILHIDRPEESAFDDRPAAQFLRQSIRVVDVPGKTVDKPVVGNDDVFRSAVLGHAAAGVPRIRGLLVPGDLAPKSGGAIGATSLGGSGRSPVGPGWKPSGVGVLSGSTRT